MNTTLIAPRALRWLADTQQARLLHRFDQVCNLVNERGDVLTLAQPSVPMGPFTWRRGWGEEEIGRLESGEWQAPPFPSPLSPFPSTWNPVPPWQQLRSIAWADFPAPRHFDEGIEVALQALLAGIVAENIPAIQRAARVLAGRGSGLTPTGDDVLIGVLFALWVWYPSPPMREAIATTAAPRTTTLSAAFLHAAADGEAIEPWHALAAHQPHAIDALLAIGHTSGQDAWAGFARTGRLLQTTSH
jgi:hypothetical protein